jgi:nucleoside-triphosphatase THEP1
LDCEGVLSLDKSTECLREIAEGTYQSGVQREGIVIRPVREMRVEGQRLSFKVVNLLYKERG